jgi:hypothetical protein
MTRLTTAGVTAIALAAWVLGCAAEPGAPPATAAALRHASDASGAEVPAILDTAAMDSVSRLEPGALHTVTAAPVTDWTGPGGKPFEVEIRTADPAAANYRRFGMITLRNSARSRAPDLGQFPCTACHMGRRMILRDERITDAHQNVQPLHPAQTGATCATCHAPDNVELLALKSGDRVSLDHTYRLCAQCHFGQAEAWAGGAHGKRLDGWQGRRVVMGCADCHDPHRPAIESRIPFRAPQLERPPARRP